MDAVPAPKIIKPPMCPKHGYDWQKECNGCVKAAPVDLVQQWQLEVEEEGLPKDPITTEAVVRAYIKSLHTTTWPPMSWSVQHNKGMENAVEWAIKFADEINGIRNMAMSSDKTLEEVAEMYRRMIEGEKYG